MYHSTGLAALHLMWLYGKLIGKAKGAHHEDAGDKLDRSDYHLHLTPLSTPDEGVVLDLFAGSGSTLVALARTQL